jgi:predicted Fe-Mo cluster-binding NifX family protein
MRICFPVEQDSGLDSPVCGHFGQAPFFLVVDTDTMEVADVIGQDGQGEHGRCRPVALLKGSAIDAIVVGGIGQGAIANLSAQGIRVVRAAPGSVRENLELIRAGRLGDFPPGWTCEEGHQGGHGAGGCGHGGQGRQGS